MNTRYLFPYYFRLIGWILFSIALILFFIIIFYNYEIPFLKCKVFAIDSGDFTSSRMFKFIEVNISNELSCIFFILGALFIAFSKEKYEDEYISKIRLESLLWATYVNYGLLILCFILFYGLSFLTVMMFNMFTLLIFFLLRFYIMKIKLKRQLKNEE